MTAEKTMSRLFDLARAIEIEGRALAEVNPKAITDAPEVFAAKALADVMCITELESFKEEIEQAFEDKVNDLVNATLERR